MTRADRLAATILSLGPIGRIPCMPGTAGSLAALLLLLGLGALGLDRRWLAPLGCALFGALTLAFGGRARAIWGEPDPHAVVSDEASGMCLALWVLPPDPAPLGTAFAAFALFRAFDIAKPLGCTAIQRVSGAAGVLLDDLLAGLYAALLVHLGLLVLGS